MLGKDKLVEDCIMEQHPKLPALIKANFGLPTHNAIISDFRLPENPDTPISYYDIDARDTYGIADAIRALRSVKTIYTDRSLLVEGTLQELPDLHMSVLLDGQTLRALRNKQAPWTHSHQGQLLLRVDMLRLSHVLVSFRTIEPSLF
jgi:hypothetical protein